MRRRRRRCSRPWRRPTAAGSSGRRRWAWRRWWDSKPTWTPSSCCSPRCWCRPTPRCCTPGGGRTRYGRSRTRAFRQSFLVAYAIRIGERLSQAAEHASRKPRRSRRPRPAARRRRAGAGSARSAGRPGAVPRRAPPGSRRRRGRDVRRHPRRGRSVRATDAEGWASGRAAADLASLHNQAKVPNRSGLNSRPPSASVGSMMTPRCGYSAGQGRCGPDARSVRCPRCLT